MSPGPPYQWDIDYGEIDNYEFDGSLYQLTVRRDEANVLIYIWSLVNDSYDLYPREVILPDGVTPKELSEISIQNMRTSENVAIAVALKNVGYEISSKGDGVAVVGILDDSPVKDKLKKGERLGLIRFGSSMEYKFPTSYKLNIKENIKVDLGNIIGKM